MKPNLSERIRPNSEAAPWVLDAVVELELELTRREAQHLALGRVLTNLVTDAKSVFAGSPEALDAIEWLSESIRIDGRFLPQEVSHSPQPNE